MPAWTIDNDFITLIAHSNEILRHGGDNNLPPPAYLLLQTWEGDERERLHNQNKCTFFIPCISDLPTFSFDE